VIQLDSRLEAAVYILWVRNEFNRGEEALQILKDLEAEGNMDACYFLARCYDGECFINKAFGFPEDDGLVDKYLNKSIEGGSAIGMFGGRRFGGFTPRCGSFIHAPFSSDKEIWDEMCATAQAGEIFAQYLVSNAYYYGDIIEFLGIDTNRMDRQALYNSIHGWKDTAVSMYEDQFSKGMFMGAGNCIDILTSGEWGIPKDEARVKRIRRMAADAGNPTYYLSVGIDLVDAEPDTAEKYLDKALEAGNNNAWFYKAWPYTFRGKKPRDLSKAKVYLENCIHSNASDNFKSAAHGYLGEIFFYGGDGVEQDYAQAFSHFTTAFAMGDKWSAHMLGTCYLKGWGTAVDYQKAYQVFGEAKSNMELVYIGLGEMYAYGLGVRKDIPQAISYWDKYPNNERAIENKKHFKKTLFGWKQI